MLMRLSFDSSEICDMLPACGINYSLVQMSKCVKVYFHKRA